MDQVEQRPGALFWLRRFGLCWAKRPQIEQFWGIEPGPSALLLSRLDKPPAPAWAKEDYWRVRIKINK
jgi:hypothetical protein